MTRYQIVLDPGPAAVTTAMPNAARARFDAAMAALQVEPYAEPQTRPYHSDGPAYERQLVIGTELLIAYWVDDQSQTVVVAAVVWLGS